MKALAALGTFTSRTLNHRPSTRCAGPPLRSGPSGDCLCRACGKPLRASRKAGPRSTARKCGAGEPLRCRGPTCTCTPMPTATERWVCRHACAPIARPTASAVRYVTVQDRRAALTNAERQARYRERSKAGESRIRYRRPADRRSRPQQWNDAAQTLLELQEQYRQWQDALPESLDGSATRSCSSRSAIWICRYWRPSSCPGASGVTASAPARIIVVDRQK